MKFKYNHEKNAKLLELRGAGFDEIIQFIAEGHLVRITHHYNVRDYPNQNIMHVRVMNKVYLVPYITEADGSIFLKTLYPSRKATKKYWPEIP